jgi:hypothetical protein
MVLGHKNGLLAIWLVLRTALWNVRFLNCLGTNPQLLLLVLLLLTNGLVLSKLLYWLCRYTLSAFVPPLCYTKSSKE